MRTENARTDMVSQGLMKRLEGMLEAPSNEIQEYATWTVGKFVERDSAPSVATCVSAACGVKCSACVYWL